MMDTGPQFAMYKLLQYLENRREYDVVDPKAWLYVGFLCLDTGLQTVVDFRVSWLMWSALGLPIRSTLTTLLFEKMMKIKDCKEPPKSEEDKTKSDDKLNGATMENGNKTNASKIQSAKKDSEKKKKANQSDQDIINMFAVDCNQVAAFGAINQFYVMFASKVIISLGFLLLLVGWESLAAGCIPIILVFPLNKFLTTRYGKVQKLLMAARDKKTKVVSEALQGIRQIKFSAHETQWTDKINTAREDEIKLLWKTKLINIYMTFSGDIAPAFLTVFALATYSWIHGDLMPSVAFTALGLFISLEGMLGLVPLLFMMGINAKVSCDRIDTFLKSAEKLQSTYPGEVISFDNVSITFPSTSNEANTEEEEREEEDDEERVARQNRFTMRDLSFQFPNNALTIITGPTGSGKSLLLAAILGEVDVLSGSITVPRSPSENSRFDSKANASNWILPSAIAFVSQIPWIENATIKNNILFGLPLDEDRYAKVLKACALTQDLDIFVDGDSTEVGAQGISLSGGQKWRLTLARALYSRAGILILDDVFSARDAHVGREIFENALTGELAQGRTRVLVTHHVALCLPKAEYVVYLSAKGTVEHAGPVKDLAQESAFGDLMKAENERTNTTAAGEEEMAEAAEVDHANDSTSATSKPPSKKLVEDEARATGSVGRSVYIAYLKATGGIPFWAFVLMFYIIAQTLTLSRSWWIKIWTSSYEDTEGRTNGFYYQMQTAVTIANSTTTNSIVGSKSLGSEFVSALIGSSISQLSSAVLGPELAMSHTGYTTGVDYTPSHFVDAEQNVSTNRIPSLPVDINNRSLKFYLVGYIIISLVSTLVDVGRYYIVYRGSLGASRKIFKDMCFRVLRTPLRWLDTVPTGRILNRFTADFNLVDSQLSSDFAQVGASFLSILGILVAALLVSPYIIFLAFVLMAVCSRIALRYIRGARSIQRLESISKSPMISHFTAALQGLSTIRAFSNIPIFESRMNTLIDSFSAATWHNWLFNNWVNFYMAMIGSIFSTFVAAFVVSTHGIDASLGGFALAFALSFRRTVQSTLRYLAATELDMNAAERVFEYSALAIENPDGCSIRASWPEKGELEVKDLEVGYAEDLPAILKGLSFHAESNQRIGIVGRTGAGKSFDTVLEASLTHYSGKSTLSLALFRFLEARKGSIVIDGVDISTIKLHDLRTRLAVIPQDPVLFSGTIRSNLDPFDQFSDNELKEALQRVHLVPSADTTPLPERDPEEVINTTNESSTSNSSTVIGTESSATENINIFRSLSSPISSSGGNLSQGQKQLLCLARAILSRPKLLILDEATSAVDKDTDTLIQRSIREEFANTTLLVIAHRLSTVMDFDRILVMRDGKAEEFGDPNTLMGMEDGVFKGMVESSGEKGDFSAK
jgi:ABC-type multidrug transport system fused ATPase/permease subunit